MLLAPPRANRRPPMGARVGKNPFTVGLVHAWADPVGGGIRDACGFVNGTFGSGSAGNPSGNTWVTGASGWGVNFDDTGTGSTASPVIVVGGSSGNGGPRSNKFSIQARIRIPSAPSGTPSTLIGASAGGIQFRIDNTTAKLTLNKAFTAAMGTSSGAVPTGRDADVGVDYDGSTVRFYIDGKLDSTASSSQTFSNVQYWIGSNNAAGTSERLQNGSRIYWMNVWNRSRAPAEFALLNSYPDLIADTGLWQALLFGIGAGGTTFTATLTATQAQSASRIAAAQAIKAITQASATSKLAAVSSTRTATQASTGSKVAQAQGTKSLTQASTALIVKAVAAIKTVTQASTATRNRLWSQALTAAQSAAASITSSVIPAGTLVFNWIVHWTRRGRRKR